jgi:hypothetical protein
MINKRLLVIQLGFPVIFPSKKLHETRAYFVFLSILNSLDTIV